MLIAEPYMLGTPYPNPFVQFFSGWLSGVWLYAGTCAEETFEKHRRRLVI